MKKGLYIVFVMAMVLSLLTVGISPAYAADDDSHYYYKIKLTTKIDYSELTEELTDDSYIYYALHGVKSGYVNDVLDGYSVDGDTSNHRTVVFQPGVSEQTNEIIFYSNEPLIALRLLKDGAYFPGAYDDTQYYMDISGQTQQPGLENALEIDQMCRIEGFADGGSMILSQPTGMLFNMKYDAPPTFSSAENMGEYYTTQKVKVQDSNLVSVMLNGTPVEIENGEAVITLPGNTNTTYDITAEDEYSTSYLTVIMCELDELMDPVKNINEDNVTPKDESTIQATLDEVRLVSQQASNATDGEKEQLKEMEEELENLLACINGSQDLNGGMAPVGPETPDDSDKAETPRSPKTGAVSQIAICLSVLMMSSGALITSKRKKI